MSRLISRALGVFIFLLLSVVAYAQTAQFSGRVIDPSQAVVRNAEVRVVNQATDVERKVTTNADGLYTVPFVSPGTYQILVQAQGFSTAVSQPLTVTVGQALVFDVEMKVGGAQEQITVNGSDQDINTTDGSVSTVVDQQFVANIPMNGRSFQSLIALTPGVVTVPGASPGLEGEFSVNGQRAESNYYMVDGVSVNTGVSSNGGLAYANGMTPSETALGTTQSMASLDAMEEFRINTSSYSAEFGRTPGGQISIQTRSGTNKWHGTGFDYLRNGALDANNWFNNEAGLAKTAERQNDFGGTLGGPVHIPEIYDGKDRTFFFFSYEGLRLAVPQAALITMVPDMYLRQNTPAAIQPLVNAFPLPNGAEQGNGLALFTAAYSEPSTLDAYSIRGDQVLGSNVRAFGRYSQSPSDTASRVTKSLANVKSTSFEAKTLTLGVTGAFSPQFSNEFRFNSTWADSSVNYSLSNFGGAQPLTSDQVFSAPPPRGSQFNAYLAWGGRPSFELTDYSSDQRQLNVTDSFSLVHGRHMLKFGVDLRRISTYEYADTLANLYYFYSPNQLLQNSAQDAFIITYGVTPPDAIFWNYSTYVQDEWRVNNRLHLSLGLRWDVNPAPTNGNGIQSYTLNQITNLSTAQLAPQGTPLYETDYKGFAPRFGVAYRLRGQPGGRETVIRGGVGLFYDAGNTTAAYGLSGGVGFGSNTLLSQVSFPLTAAQDVAAPASISSPYNAPVTAADPHLRLPYTTQWNVALEQALSANQTLTVGYVGADGRRLLYTSYLDPSQINNPNFSLGNGLNLIANGASSNYNALQIQFVRRLSYGLQVLASYTWSHSIDDLSSDYDNTDPPLRGNSDFDVRSNFSTALTYDVSGHYSNRFAGALLKYWGFDARITGRSALPFSVSSGYVTLPSGVSQDVLPNLLTGVPIYLSDPTAPGGRVVNIAAFQTPPADENGSAPRNFLRGFDCWQTDLGLRRDFPLHERLKLQFKAEAFNVFNHANFGTIDNYLPDGSDLFGRATSTLNSQLGGLNPLYQQGGPRSMQVSLKVLF
jgi:hypothetical protein